ncbi:cAMP-binding domain of CRP or a regulatory subunit of cAMP-dependent protein kinases [Flavobacteriaceae bacterium MAR_2010_188]|nr:cAMP-binding domain of CRP or a regulatory subunit of cAMP-dependent protein kinases [Flavobacteriaceae bacterium MAR_2010_188]
MSTPRYPEITNHVLKEIDLTNEELEEFLSILSEQVVLRKDNLIVPGDVVDYEYYVVKGCMKAYFMDSFGDRHILQFAVEDWWISDFEAFFNNEAANLYVEAIEDTYLLGIHREALEILYKRIPKFERFFRLKTTAAFISLRRRVLSTLQLNSKERYLKFCEKYPSIAERVPNYHIANYLGIKPESLSRIRRETLG